MMAQNNIFTPMAARQFSAAPQKRDLSALVPDYSVPEYFQKDLRKIEMTTAEEREQHPLEYAVQHSRKRLDYLSQMGKNEVLIFNLPKSATKEQVEALCTEKKGVQVMGMTLNKSLDPSKSAFAYIKLASPSQVKLLRERFRNVWLEDKKLKLKGLEELGYESFNHRTIIVQNIPVHFKKENLVELFSRYGAVTGVELPTKNATIEEEIKNKLTQVVKERREKQAIDTRRAQAVVQESVRENEQYYRQVLTQALGSSESADSVILQLGGAQPFQEGSNADKITQQLNSQRQNSIQQMLFQLQSETAEVSKARQVLLALRDGAQSNTLGGRDFEEVQQSIVQNKGLLKDSISYINNNRSNINEQTLEVLNQKLLLDKTGTDTDPIHRLLNLSQSELAQAYDSLVSALNQREKLIEQRIKGQIDHLGKDERILFENKDWQKELEDLKVFDNAFGESDLLAEDYIPLNEQVTNVHEERHITPEDRFVKLVQNRLNPFFSRNFNKEQLAFSDSPVLDSDVRIPTTPPDMNKAPTVNRLLFEGFSYTEGSLEAINAQIAELRDQFDLPFDELYQKEKKLVDAVIKATEALRNKEALLSSPITEDRAFDISELKGTYIGDEYHSEHRFVRDQRKRNSKLLTEQLDNSGSSAFNFSINETQNLMDKYLADGTLSKKEYDEYARWHKEMSEVNFGYAFVTFSHSDEAKLAIIVGNGTEADKLELDISIKQPHVDHKDLDFSYSINKQRNEAKLTEELKGLREARKELRDFERNIDTELPSMKKMRKFQGMAKDLIDGSRSHTGALMQRTEREEAAILDKIRLLQKENPDKDYTQLFDSERAEIARKAQHKKAFASYKAFQFLKHGVELQSRGAKPKAQEISNKPAPYQVNDPYNFPELNSQMEQQMPKGELYPRVMDAGDSLGGNGRKFGYTNDDFLRAYFGKDYARLPVFNNDDSNLFQVNESLSRRFPINKYIVGPSIEERKELLEERSGIEGQDFGKVVESFDPVYSQRYEDVTHPTDASRTLVKDAQRRIETYFKRREKTASDNDHLPLWSTYDIAGIKKSLREEYFPKPKEVPVETAEGDTKAEEKFEPFFEGETPTASDSIPASTDSSTDSALASESASSEKKQSPSAYNPKKQQGNKPPRQDYKRGAQYMKQGGAVVPKRVENQLRNPLLDEINKDPLLESLESTNLNKDAYVNKDQMELNREYIYDAKYRKEKGIEVQKSVQQQRFDRSAALNGEESEELLERMRNLSKVSDDSYKIGHYNDRNRFGVSASEFDVIPRQRQTRSITDFAGALNNEDLSEREDEDIYRHYMDQMRKEKESDKKAPLGSNLNERLAQQKLKELQDLHPEMPRFDGYLRSMASNESPFEDHAKTQADKDYDVKAEEQYDQELLQRELKGRLLGETLSPKQFAMLYNAQLDKRAAIVFQKDQDRKQFIDHRDIVRLQDEEMESARIRKVMSGDWTEEESHGKIRDFVAHEAQRLQDNEREHEQQIKFNREEKQFLSLMMGDEESRRSTMEKEYYFDEGLGQSLKDHVGDLKSRFPELDVQVRRDREGFPIVKSKCVPKYKYDIDKALAFNHDDTVERINQSIEDIHESVTGLKASSGEINTQELEQRLTNALKNNGNGNYDFDMQTKDQIDNLWKERITGKYLNDRQGFARAFLDVQKNAKLDISKPASLFEIPESPATTYFETMQKERELMTVEIMMQVTGRIKHHLFMKERKLSDFAVPRMSEQAQFAAQKISHTNALTQMEGVISQMDKETEKEGFDKEAYQKIKAEIKQRREAKERLLQQGFPELKPYISI